MLPNQKKNLVKDIFLAVQKYMKYFWRVSYNLIILYKLVIIQYRTQNYNTYCENYILRLTESRL